MNFFGTEFKQVVSIVFASLSSSPIPISSRFWMFLSFLHTEGHKEELNSILFHHHHFVVRSARCSLVLLCGKRKAVSSPEFCIIQASLSQWYSCAKHQSIHKESFNIILLKKDLFCVAGDIFVK
ncbi:unnamed protein product [Orchesella dallaii]|uniref:Uncharacterized protein n=1 Tax=Orchesella dallaii TaxID=48710 RepID=A0ABP1PPL5_9HEXA